MSNALLNLCFVFIGGGIGACARWQADHIISAILKPESWPWGTFIVNMSGAFLIGLLAYFASHGRSISPSVWLLAATGFLGSYTTFSTLCMQLFSQYMEKDFLLVISYALVSVIAGFCLVWLAYWLGKQVYP